MSPGCSPTCAGGCDPTHASRLQPDGGRLQPYGNQAASPTAPACNPATLRTQAAARSPRSSTPTALAACDLCAPSPLTRRRRCSRPWLTAHPPSPRTSRRCSRGPRATSSRSRRRRRRGKTRRRRRAAPRRSPSCAHSRRATSGSRTLQPVCNSGCPWCRRCHTSAARNLPEGSALACAPRLERSPGRLGPQDAPCSPPMQPAYAYAAHLHAALRMGSLRA